MTTENEVKVTKASAPKQKMVKIKLPRAAYGEENFITASLNGEVFKIMKGVEVEVPDYIAEIIQNSFEHQDKADEFLESLVRK